MSAWLSWTMLLFWGSLVVSAMAVSLILIWSLGAHRRVSSVLVIIVPLMALAVYILVGSPTQSDQPLMDRLAGNIADLPRPAAIIRLEQEVRQLEGLASVEGWQLLARLRYRQGAYDRSILAWQRVQALAPDVSAAYTGQARAEIALADGTITPDSLILFEHAVRLAPDDIETLYFLGSAYRAMGAVARAITTWEKLVILLPPEAPIRMRVVAQLDALRVAQ